VIGLIFSKALDSSTARRSICAVPLTQLICTLRGGMLRCDGIVGPTDVNIHGTTKQIISTCLRLALVLSRPMHDASLQRPKDLVQAVAQRGHDEDADQHDIGPSLWNRICFAAFTVPQLCDILSPSCPAIS
jgi:hypothetical protein